MIRQVPFNQRSLVNILWHILISHRKDNLQSLRNVNCELHQRILIVNQNTSNQSLRETHWHDHASYDSSLNLLTIQYFLVLCFHPLLSKWSEATRFKLRVTHVCNILIVTHLGYFTQNCHHKLRCEAKRKAYENHQKAMSIPGKECCTYAQVSFSADHR